jgi:hypothetical protein
MCCDVDTEAGKVCEADSGVLALDSLFDHMLIIVDKWQSIGSVVVASF